MLSAGDVVDSARHDPDYGYHGKLYEIRREEYANLAGTSTVGPLR